MIAINIVLMIAVVVSLVGLLASAIVADRKSQRAAGGEVPPAEAPLTRNLVMPRELRSHGVRVRSTRPARRVAGSTPARTASR